MSDQLEKIIDGERKLIRELRQDATNAQQLSDLNNEQISALMERLDRSQHKSARRQYVFNVLVAFVSLAVGYLLNLLGPPDWLTGLFQG